MRLPLRCLHAVTVISTVVLFGALLFFALGSIGLRSASHETLVEWSTLALPFLLGVLCLWGVWKKVRYRWLLPLLGASAGLVGYLAFDQGARPPPPEVARLVSADSKSYEAYRWLLKNDPHSRVAEKRKELAELPPFPSEHAEWPAFFTEHRVIFVEGWGQDTLGRDWTEVMAANLPDGIYPPPKTEDAFLDFSTIRRSAKIRWGYAQVLLLDDRPDEAAKLLLPFLRAHYHLQAGGSSLVTEMIALVCVRGTYEQLELLADSDRLSPAIRSEIVAALAGAPSPQSILRNAFEGEQVFLRASSDRVKNDYETTIKSVTSPQGARIPANKFIWRLFFNPHQSEWEYREFLRETGRLAEQRQLGSAEKPGREFAQRTAERRVKNPVGQMSRQSALPAFAQVTEIIWQTDDRRETLLTRLKSP